MVKTTSALSAFDSGDGDSTSIPRFCHQHIKELLGPSGYYARKTGEWVEFEGMISQCRLIVGRNPYVPSRRLDTFIPATGNTSLTESRNGEGTVTV
jgi:hypothetical protein